MSRPTLWHLCLSALLLSQNVFALIGFPIPMYKPPCAFGCRAAIAGKPLDCTGNAHGAGGHGGSGPTTPECRAQSEAFLTTLAHCIQTRCEGIAVWRLEKYWADKSTGDPSVLPMWGYQDSVERIKEIPTKFSADMEVLNSTALVTEDSWRAQTDTLENFEYSQVRHSEYGIILLVGGFGAPIVASLFYRLPFGSHLMSKLKPYLLPLTVSKAVRERMGSGGSKPPSVGQTVYIVFYLVLNIIFSAIGYRAMQVPYNTWYNSTYQEILAYFSSRTGVLAFAIAPLVILFSSRNNVLLWLTGFSHSTYVLLHRWLARIFTLQVILHSIAELVVYLDMDRYDEESLQEYWIWGIVATIACVMMLLMSMSWLRILAYEVFLVLHIILAVFVLVGSWFHVEYLFEKRWGYEFWLYTAFAVWGFDRFMRLFRMVKNGLPKAEVRKISDEIFRIDISGIRWQPAIGRHAYIYLPTLTWRAWENHPFSIVPSHLLVPGQKAHSICSPESPITAPADIEKSALATTTAAAAQLERTVLPSATSGITFYVKKGKGATCRLIEHSELPVLLDGPYPGHRPRAVLRTDRVVLIAGGIGITAVLPYIAAHPNTKIYWSVKSNGGALVQDIAPALEKATEKEVKIGERFSIDDVIESETAGDWVVGVVVCGPESMNESVRNAVSKFGKMGRKVEVVIEEFAW